MDPKKKKSNTGPALLGIVAMVVVAWAGLYLVRKKRENDAAALEAQAKADAMDALEQHFDSQEDTSSTSPPDSTNTAPSVATAAAAAAVVSCAQAKVAYLNANADVRAAKLDAWTHFKSNGEREGRIWPGTRCDDAATFVLTAVTAPAAESTKLSNKLKNNTPLIVGTVVSGVLSSALPLLIKKMVYGKLKSKVMSRTTMKALKLVSKQLEKLGLKLGEKGLSRLGLMATKKAAGIGARVAQQQAIAGATGPAFPFVDAAFFAFDILTIGLDLGDAGGYDKMGTKKMYLKMKAGIEAEIKKTYEANGVPYPAIVGPLDKILPDDLNTLVSDQVAAILAVPDNKFMQPILDKIAAAGLTDVDAVTQFMDDNSDLIDMDAVHALATDNVCVAKGGMVLGSDHACSYATRESCESSYSWPLNEENGDIYAEFNKDAGGPGQAACVTASYALRGICSANNLPYDSERGICKIDEKYCLTKSATWAMSKDLNEYDCIVPAGQQIAQAIFGTTITNGLNQIFNTDQYSKCVPPAVDDRYSCRITSCKDGLEPSGILGNDMAKASTTLIVAGADTGPPGAVVAGLGFLAKNELCYPRCKDHYEGSSFLCLETCPVVPANEKPWTNNELSCTRSHYCDPGKDHQLALCYNACDKVGYEGKLNNCVQTCPANFKDDGLLTCFKPPPYGRGVGTIPLKKPCADGLRDDGVSCWKDDKPRGPGRIPDKAPCPPGLRDDGTSCWADDYTTPPFLPANKGKCRAQNPDVGCYSKASLYYAACKPGYRKRGDLLCEPNGSAGIKKTLFQRQSCRADEDMYGGLCYSRCPSGMHNVGCCICQPDDGLAGIRTTLMQRQYCPDGTDLIAGLCQTRCQENYHAVGTSFCSINCPTDMTDLGISCGKKTYARDAGVPDTQIKIKDSYTRGGGQVPTGIKVTLKKRVVPFSTKEN